MTTTSSSLWRPALCLFLVFQGLFGLTASGRVSRVADEFEVYLQTESLWDRGSLAIDQCPDGVFFGRKDAEGHKYAPYGPGGAVLALPHHALGRAVAAVVGVERSNPAAWTELVAAVTSLSTSTWAALAVVGLFLAACALGAPRRRAFATAVLLGTSTLLWHYGTVYYSEAIAAALAIWTCAFVWRRQPALAALSTSALILLKITNGILVPGLLVLAWLPTRAGEERSWRRAVPVAAGVALAVLVHASWNYARFGDLLAFGYGGWRETIPQGPARPFLLSELPRGLFGLLLSPGKSLILFAPPLVLACAPARLRAFAHEHPGPALGAATALGCSLLFYGSYMFWEGGYCFGPRHLVPLVPLLLLPLAWGPPPSARAWRAVLLVGVVVQALGVSVSYHEDQVIGERADREVYYRLVDDPPQGRPRNVYRLDYNPLATYLVRLSRHLRTPSPAVGEGLEFLRAHLLRVRAFYPGGEGIPPWLPQCLLLPFAVCLLAGLRLTRPLGP